MVKKTEEQIREEVLNIELRISCEDNPELKEMILAINSKVSDKAKQLHKESIVIDTCTFSLDRWSWNLAESGCTAINCTVPNTKSDAGDAVRRIVDYYSTVQYYSDHLLMVDTPDDIIRAKQEGKVGVIIGAQNCEFVHHNDVDAAVNVFHRMGLRVMQIAYHHRSFAADGCATGDNAGITNDGRKMIKAMEKYGVTVDLSHVGERSTLEAMDVCTKPPIFSHSNPLAINKHIRNITDEQAKKCAALGGVVGVHCYGPIMYQGKEFPTIETFIGCIDYYVKLIGIDHVGIGLDSDAVMGAYERRTMINMHRSHHGPEFKESIYYNGYLAGRGYLSVRLDGLINMANLCNVTDHLLMRGYSEKDIKKILGENWLRVFRETW